jgi:hypothetical protein
MKLRRNILEMIFFDEMRLINQNIFFKNHLHAKWKFFENYFSNIFSIIFSWIMYFYFPSSFELKSFKMAKFNLFLIKRSKNKIERPDIQLICILKRTMLSIIIWWFKTWNQRISKIRHQI